MTLQPLPLNLNSLVAEIVLEQRSLAESKNITLENRVPVDLPEILADRQVLQRILVNLIDNALKFTPEGGQIWLGGQLQDKEVHVSVVDTGPGIPPQERTRIFEKFTQAQGDSQTNRGTGLGLAFCQMAVEAHKGKIWVEDGPGGSGSRFVLALPQARGPGTTPGN